MEMTDRLALVPVRPVADLVDLVRRAVGTPDLDPALASALLGAAAEVEASMVTDVR